jgi:hypothetical protein
MPDELSPPSAHMSMRRAKWVRFFVLGAQKIGLSGAVTQGSMYAAFLEGRQCDLSPVLAPLRRGFFTPLCRGPKPQGPADPCTGRLEMRQTVRARRSLAGMIAGGTLGGSPCQA